MPRLPSLPRLPLVRDPLRRVRISDDLNSIITIGEEESARAGGMDERNVERIWEAALDLYRSGVHPALQICVRREGRVVLDRAIGHARGNGPRDPKSAEKVTATTDTPFVIYSAAKAITAFVVHLLIERGLVRLEAPVCEYVPEYDCHNKGGITVGHVLAHRAGVPNLPPEALDLDRIGDREFLVRVLCEAKPLSEPGKMLAYHAVSGGFILAEIVHRVTGRDIRRVLTEEILDPLRFRWGNYGVTPENVPEVGLSYVTGPATAPPLSTLLTRARRPPRPAC